MKRLRKAVAAGISLTAGLVLTAEAASAGPAERSLRSCLDAAAEAAYWGADDCVAAYLASLETVAHDDGATLNTGILGTATDGGTNHAILGHADGPGALNTGILGSASA